MVINNKKISYSFTKNTINIIEEKQNEKKSNDDVNILWIWLCDTNNINCDDECENMNVDEEYENFSEQLGEEKEPSEKEIIENLMDWLIDYEINGQNAKN